MNKKKSLLVGLITLSLIGCSKEEVNNVGTQRDDGYTVWNLQEMNYNDFPDIVGYMKDEKQGNRNLYIKDSIGMKNLQYSELCTNKDGKIPSKYTVFGLEFPTKEYNEYDFLSVLEYINTKLPIKEYRLTRSMPGYIQSDYKLLGSMREADIGKLDITKDEFRDKYNALVEEGRTTHDSTDDIVRYSSISIDFGTPNSKDFTDILWFEAQLEDDELVHWEVSAYGNRFGVKKFEDSSYFQVEYTDEKIAINLCDRYNASTIVAEWSKEGYDE